MKKFLFPFLLLYIITSGYSQTNISGGIVSNTTWTPSGNPYIVTGNTVVFGGVTLTISPGVIVKFNSGTGIEIRGKLTAIGNSDDSITFTSNLTSPVPGSWEGITVIGTKEPFGYGDQVTLEFCKVQYANTFINLNIAYNGPYIFKNCLFEKNLKVNYDGGMPTTIFDKCKFISNKNALGRTDFDSKVSNSYFLNNEYGVDGFSSIENCYFSGHTGIALNPAGSTVGCTVENNNIGVSCYFYADNTDFRNNYISNNSVGVEMLSYFNEIITFKGNTICNNKLYNLKLLYHNNADLSNNCWCSTDSASIRSGIYDGYSNISYGLVNIMPFSDNCTKILNSINTPASENILSAKVFPNPFSSNIEIINDKNELSEITLFDITGRKILQQKYTGSAKLDTELITEGLYFYLISNQAGLNQTGQIVKD